MASFWPEASGLDAQEVNPHLLFCGCPPAARAAAVCLLLQIFRRSRLHYRCSLGVLLVVALSM